MTEDIRLNRVLLTNDDGIDAPGLAVLAEVASSFAKEVWIVAPTEDQSGASQRLSLRQPIRVEQRDQRHFAVKDGSPADCVAFALGHLMADQRPSLVLSGVNATSTIGEEVNLSGTVGAALTSLILGTPAMAISQAAISRADVPWITAREILPRLMQDLLKTGWRKETCLSINIPDMPADRIAGYSWARQSHKSIAAIRTEKRTSPRGQDYFWLSLEAKNPVPNPHSEIAILRRGEIAITALSPDRSVHVDREPVSFIEKEEAARSILDIIDDE